MIRPLIKVLILSFMFLSGLIEINLAQVSRPDSSVQVDSAGVSVPFRADSTKTTPASFTATARDSIPPRKIAPAQTGLDSSVTYRARRVVTDLVKNVTDFIGDAEVKYKNYTMRAGKITVRWNESLLVAESLPDSGNGSSSNGDSLIVTDPKRPVFSDGREEMVGDKMEFNFKTERGRVIRGRTALQGGYYGGETVKRVGPRVINIKNGIYTTCSNDEPHFRFAGKKMKILLDDKVIAKPVIFFIGKIPLLYLPFALFPSQEDGRQSGVILPQYGSSPAEGRYLLDMGYYWAASEYYDARFTLSFFEKTGVLFRTHWNYARRYSYNGTIAGSYTRKSFPGGTRERRWDLRVQHSQTIDRNTRLSVNGTFVSNNTFFQELSNNRSQRLRRQLISNATFSKRWGEGKNSLTVNLSQTKDLDSGSELITLPQLSFSRTQSAIFPFNKDKKSRPGQAAEPSWYNYIRYGYRGSMLNRVRKDTSSADDVDRNAQHDITLSYTNPKKLFGWLSWNLSSKYDEDWFTETQTFALDSTSNLIQPNDREGFEIRRLFNLRAGASTKLYGTFNTGIGPVKAIRHVMTPTVSFSYQPDFSDAFWGYWQAVTDSAGKVQLRDRFGGTPQGERNTLGFGLSNLFQMKVGSGDKEKKIDLFNLNFNSGYNVAADSLKLSNLSTNFRANPRKNLNISMTMSHSFYAFDQEANRVVNRFIVPRRTNLSLRAQWTIGGKSSSGAQSAAQSTPSAQTQLGQSPFGGTPGDRFAPESAFSAFDIPWRASLSFFFSESKFNPNNVTRNAYIDLRNAEVKLTRNWRIGYRVRYDLTDGEFADQRISFYRDLHCWEAQFNWSPSGVSKGYYFRIGIKAPHLRDVQLERRGGTTSVFRPF